MSYLTEELPLFRAKLPGVRAGGCTGPDVGPGSYDVDTSCRRTFRGTAPFGRYSDRFEGNDVLGVPGVGTYDIIPVDVRKGEISIVPFNSRVKRFHGNGGDDFPGPGAYTIEGYPTKRRCRSHPIRFSSGRDSMGNDLPGPGHYNPKYVKGGRSKSGTLHFGEYSGRKPAEAAALPGPGHYECDGCFKSIYSRKPTISFSSKTERSQNCDNSGNPGPGSYNLPGMFQSKQQYKAANPETLLAFGTKSSRYGPCESDSYPGPGAYTGEIAPRRPYMYNGGNKGRVFVSVSERVKHPVRSNIGPGSYDPRVPRKGPRYGVASVSFWSNVDRFPAAEPVDEKIDFVPRHEAVRVPRRIHPARILSEAISKFVKPKVPQSSFDYLGDEQYDYVKPKCTNGGYLGSAPRVTSTTPRNNCPGPGQYEVCDDSSFGRSYSQKGTWGNDGRFKRTVGGVPGPGHYSYDTTFLRKSFNRTVNQSDNM